jgi:hypothetical protein
VQQACSAASDAIANRYFPRLSNTQWVDASWHEELV